jgi:hypothetical protein
VPVPPELPLDALVTGVVAELPPVAVLVAVAEDPVSVAVAVSVTAVASVVVVAPAVDEAVCAATRARNTNAQRNATSERFCMMTSERVGERNDSARRIVGRGEAFYGSWYVHIK